jgi:DNA-binding response OmpR family regulator
MSAHNPGSRLAIIVEDNPEIGEIYSTALQLSSFTTELIADGREALERLGDIVPTLLILDVNLPNVSGHFLYKKVRSDTRFDQTPVIIATANLLVSETLGKDLGPRDKLLVKPISPRHLREVAETMVAESSASAQGEGGTAETGSTP